METQVIEITNTDFFNAIDNQVRAKYAMFETGSLLPIVEKLLKDSNIDFSELLDYPVEGYYYKSEPLKRFFKIVRNLQENDVIFDRVLIDSEEFKYIKDITDRELFGKVRSGRREQSGQKPSILPRRYDIIALTMSGEDLFEVSSTKPWSMENIIKHLDKKFTNTPNLTELAYLTKDKACLVCAAETNSLYRDFVYISGCSFFPLQKQYIWKVDKDVEDLGRRTVEEYNKIINNGMKIIMPAVDNIQFLDTTTEKPRLARLGYVEYSGEWYYWTLNTDGSVTEEYTTQEKTTESVSNPFINVPSFYK